MRPDICDYIKSTRPPLIIAAISLIFLGIFYVNIPLFSFTSLLSILSGFLLTASVYSFNYWTDIKEDNINVPQSAIITGKMTYKKVLNFSLFCFFMAIFFSFFLSLASLILVIFIFFIGTIYSYPLLNHLLPFKFAKKRLKELPVGFKSGTIAFTWAFGSLIPIFAVVPVITFDLSLLILFLFIQVFIGTIIRDFKDISGDKKSGINTLPVVFNPKIVFFLLISLNTISIIIISISVLLGNYFWVYLYIGAFWRYIGLVMAYKNKTQSRLIYEEMNLSTCSLFAVGGFLAVLGGL